MSFCGRLYFDWFYSALKKLKGRCTVSFLVRPLTFECLPEFYDLVIESHSKGLILYYPNEFSKEQRRYIKRFKKVPQMRVVPVKNINTSHCLGVPNSIGTFEFEWHDWVHAMRTSLKKWPLIKHTV